MGRHRKQHFNRIDRKAYVAGWHAAQSGLDVNACPYTRDDWIEFWQRGWFDYWF
jgi:hypothetical protein